MSGTVFVWQALVAGLVPTLVFKLNRGVARWISKTGADGEGQSVQVLLPRKGARRGRSHFAHGIECPRLLLRHLDELPVLEWPESALVDPVLPACLLQLEGRLV